MKAEFLTLLYHVKTPFICVSLKGDNRGFKQKHQQYLNSLRDHLDLAKNARAAEAIAEEKAAAKAKGPSKKSQRKGATPAKLAGQGIIAQKDAKRHKLLEGFLR